MLTGGVNLSNSATNYCQRDKAISPYKNYVQSLKETSTQHSGQKKRNTTQILEKTEIIEECSKG